MILLFFNHGWTRINTDIWTGVLSVSICVHPWFVLFHWLCEVVEGNTNKVRGQTFVFTVPLIALFNHGWTRMNTDIWTGVLSVFICVHPWFVLFHWICRSCGGELIKYEVRLSFSRYL